ncbi:hypothetical protein RHDC4_00074 [Rhodocyclaceae bacterium]|nr:hypothetical protein RHDC4_00074 [Rhodocyclaceae bacterium]
MASQGWSAESLIENKPSLVPHTLDSFFDWLIGLSVLACLCLYLPGWGHGPRFVKWIPVGILSVLYLGKLWNASRESGEIRFGALDGITLLLAGWVATSIAWSPDTLGGRDTLIKWGLLTAIFIAARHATTPATRLRIASGAMIGIAVIIGLDVFRIAAHGGYMNPNFETEAILFAMPFLLLFSGNDSPAKLKWLVGILATAAAIFLILFNSSKIEFLVWAGCGLLFVALSLWQRSRLLASGAALLILAGIGALIYLGWDTGILSRFTGFRGSLLPRLELSLNGIAIWLDSPLLGRGAGFMYPTYPLYQEHHLQVLGAQRSILATSFYASAGALHNDLLQFLAGFGLVGLGLVVAGVVVARRQLADWRRSPDRIAGAALVVTSLLNALVDFPLQEAASAVLAVIGLAFLIPGTGGEKAQSFSMQGGNQLGSRLTALIPILFIAAIPAVGWWSYRYFIGQDAFGAARQLAFAGRPDLALQLNLGAVGAYPFDEAMRYELYNTLMFLEERSGTITVPAETHDKIFEASLSTGPGNALMILRLEYLLNSGRYKERTEEVARWRRQLATNATRLPDTWLMEGLYAIAENDIPKAKAALDRYQELIGESVIETRLEIVESIRQGIARAR